MREHVSVAPSVPLSRMCVTCRLDDDDDDSSPRGYFMPVWRRRVDHALRDEMDPTGPGNALRVANSSKASSLSLEERNVSEVKSNSLLRFFTSFPSLSQLDLF